MDLDIACVGNCPKRVPPRRSADPIPQKGRARVCAKDCEDRRCENCFFIYCLEPDMASVLLNRPNVAAVCDAGKGTSKQAWRRVNSHRLQGHPGAWYLVRGEESWIARMVLRVDGPDDFVAQAKGHRYVKEIRTLEEPAEASRWFLTELRAATYTPRANRQKVMTVHFAANGPHALRFRDGFRLDVRGAPIGRRASHRLARRERHRRVTSAGEVP